MDPGTAAAAYTHDTAVEGTAATAFAVSQPTVPLHASWTQILSPSPSLTRSSHTLSILKGKAYIFGGDTNDNTQPPPDNSMHIVTLPTDPALNDTDYQAIPAVPTPIQPASTTSSSSEGQTQSILPASRAAHSATSIGDSIYIFGGRPPNSTSPLNESGALHSFSTLTHTWTTLPPHPTRCQQSFPCPRTYASMASTEHPRPSRVGEDLTMSPIAGDGTEGGGLEESLPGKSPEGLTPLTGHGTIWIVGGMDWEGRWLRDCWALDVASGVWGRWSDVPATALGPSAGLESEVGVVCTGGRLWSYDGGGGAMWCMDVVEDRLDDMGGKGELGVSPKTGRWEGVGSLHGGEGKGGKQEKVGVSTTPGGRRGAGFIPITTGQGREYLLLLLGEDSSASEARPSYDDIYSFQLRSEKHTAALLKDKVRGLVGKQTGEYQWAKAEVKETSKEDGVLEQPGKLSRFACASGGDWGVGSVVLWGGTGERGETKGDGWVLSFE